MNKQQRDLIRAQHEFVSKYPAALTPIEPAQFPDMEKLPDRAWISRRYLVQLFYESSEQYPQLIRLSVNRSRIDSKLAWQDGLSWDELQQIKSELGYGDWWGFELFPPEREVVNVANIRHLWLLPTHLGFGWFDGTKGE